MGQRGGAAVLIHKCQCNAGDSCRDSPRASISPVPGAPPQAQPTACHPALGQSCHRLGDTVPRCRQGPQERMQPGEQRPPVSVGSQGKKHGVWHRVSPSLQESPAAPQQLLPCPARASWILQPHMQGESISVGPRKAFITETCRMGLTIPVLLRDRGQSPDDLQQPSSSYEGPESLQGKPAYMTPFCILHSQPPPHCTPRCLPHALQSGLVSPVMLPFPFKAP